MSMFIHHESVRNKIRVFEWYTKLFKWDGNSYTEAAAVILIRSTTTAGQEVIAIPFTMEEVRSNIASVLLLETIKYLPFLGSFNNLSRLSSSLSTEFALKFCPSKQNWGPRDRFHPCVFFFDIQINQGEPCLWEKVGLLFSSLCKGRKDKEDSSEDKEDLSEFITGTSAKDLKLEKIEDIEEYLKSCPGMMAVGPRGMKEAKGGMDVDVLRSGEKEVECSICSKSICVGDRFAETPCSHKFHMDCILLHRCKETTSCPICGSSYLALFLRDAP